MSQIKAVKEAVKDSLVGSDEVSAQMSAQTKARFLSNAVKDPQTGELSMGPEEFINAIAPKSEDYVSLCFYHYSYSPSRQSKFEPATHEVTRDVAFSFHVITETDKGRSNHSTKFTGNNTRSCSASLIARTAVASI